MKSKLLLIALLVLDCSVFGQEPVQRHLRHCYLDANNVANYDEIVSHWETSWGSYDRTHQHRLGLKIRVGTTDTFGGPVKVEWFWVARKMRGDLVRYGHGEKDLAIPAAFFVECYALAPQINERDQKYVLIGQRDVNGARHEGWIVRVIGDRGVVLAEKGSTEPMLVTFHKTNSFQDIPEEKL